MRINALFFGLFTSLVISGNSMINNDINRFISTNAIASSCPSCSEIDTQDHCSSACQALKLASGVKKLPPMCKCCLMCIRREGEVCGTWLGECAPGLQCRPLSFDNLIEDIRVCQPVLTPQCDRDWTVFADACYKYVSPSGGITWPDAQEECERDGSTLASIHSEREQDFIWYDVMGTKGFAWVGLSDSQSERGESRLGWLWQSDNTTYNPYTASWAHLEPNDYKWKAEFIDDGYEYGEDCVYMGKDGSGRWNDNPCQMKFGWTTSNFKLDMGYVCKRRVVQDVDVAPTTSYGWCERSWFYYQERCYRHFSTEYGHTWDSSQRECARQAATLATVQTRDEQKFIWNVVMAKNRKALAWIGLTDIDAEAGSSRSGWHWSPDGSTYDPETASWGEGQPDNDGWGDLVLAEESLAYNYAYYDEPEPVGEDCVYINGRDGGMWYDGPCDLEYASKEQKYTRLGYVCEKPASYGEEEESGSGSGSDGTFADDEK